MKRLAALGGYRWAGVVFLVSCLAAGVYYLFALTQTTYQVESFQALGWVDRPFTLSPGSYTFWIEGPQLSARRFPAGDYRKELFPHLLDPARREVPLTPTRSQVFNTGEREGRSLWRFTAPTRGSYSFRMETRYREDVNVPSADSFAISPGHGLRWPVRPWLGVIFLTGVLICLLLVVTTWLVRRRDMRRYLEQDAIARRERLRF